LKVRNSFKALCGIFVELHILHQLLIHQKALPC